MKNNQLKEELKSLPAEQLKERLQGMRRDLLGLRLNAMATHVKDYSQFEKLRRNIARILTYARQQGIRL